MLNNHFLHLQNERGEWPLYVAASHGHLEMVQDLERVGECTAWTCVPLSSKMFSGCIQVLMFHYG